MVPETAWQRAVVMAIERGKFQNLLFDDFDRLDHAALRAAEEEPPGSTGFRNKQEER